MEVAMVEQAMGWKSARGGISPTLDTQQQITD